MLVFKKFLTGKSTIKTGKGMNVADEGAIKAEQDF